MELFSTRFTCRESNIKKEIRIIADRIMDELVVPLSKLRLDDTEFACLKALTLFDFSKFLLKFYINLK